ncbi:MULTISPECIES: uracil-DNA glycosylase family protein [Haemophilus]|uniref:Predicted uracil-DNA glycosylase n=3 Tax=Haemophilus TaxID=724 RepID=A0AAV2U5P1_HAEIF|nr:MULTISPECIES: uracil-DNA glycosylase family protein [Haemophilus]EGF15135.1 uracil DNA glycosylase [Haemophilus aegyptius ATCC 11116]OBX81222.1 uracil-DNA glycosylase [Haemophilus aegyptius]QEQ58627.1 uracil-DNA glycosylase family protein [Haemophilus influenzae biotype aegyptius]QEQ59856.1 uracil-DNA glycosylase family protein [Haemophilus influenzae biotype aegyptius]TMQ42850.1 uracil-DNA glycosylase [Haemophilus influenzae biotype aegyptius]
MLKNLDEITSSIIADPQNKDFTERGIFPLFSVPKTARINIVGQAPGLKAEQSRLYWNDKSGERLREWLGVDYDYFYNSGMFSVLPMDFYYPGKGKSGDLPPRQGFAERWHSMILGHLPNIQLTILIGQYAQKYYLPENKDNVTNTVKNYRQFLPHFMPLVHPSPRNQLWVTKNPWFEEQVIPELQILVKQIINKD